MDLTQLEERASLLQAEYQKSRAYVTECIAQLEQSKSQCDVISGHLNELGYLMAERRKLNDDITQSESIRDVSE